MGKVPASFKKANIVPIHKKEAKTIVENYRPISLLSVMSKVLEKIIFKYVYNYFRENFILSVYQSGFQTGMSTVTQLIEVYHRFCKAVDDGKEIRVVFLDIKKAFDKVWHRGLLYKLSRCGIGGNLLIWFEDYLKNRMQRVIINGQASNWGTLNAGVPQGSVLGPLLFLLFINDISNVVNHCQIRLFADDTCLFIEVENTSSDAEDKEKERKRQIAANFIDEDLHRIQNWSNSWLVTFSPPKTKSLIISNKNDVDLNPKIHINGYEIDEVKHHKYLGLTFSYNLKWSEHINDISTKARKRLSLMTPLKFKLDRRSLEIMYTAFALPTMEYGNVVWGGTYENDLQKLEKIHVDAMRLVTGATARSNINNLYNETKWQSISLRHSNAVAIMLFKIKHDFSPEYLRILLPPENTDRTTYQLRNRENTHIPAARLESFKRSFFPFSTRVWNDLPSDLRNSRSLEEFKTKVQINREVPNILYYYGERWPAVHHSRLRIGCSKLKFDLCFNLKVIENPQCSCGARYENAFHFFMQCPNYADIRLNLFSIISIFTKVTVDTIFHGHTDLTSEQNEVVIEAVHSFILKSERFL